MRSKDAQAHALRFLKRQLLSTSELRIKLEKKGFESSEIDSVITDLTKKNFLNDARLAEDRSRIGVTRKLGRHQVKRKLDQAGIDSEVSRDAVESTYEYVDEASLARELLRKRLNSFSKLKPEAAYRRAVGLLLRRGYDDEIIRPAIAEVLGIDPDIDS